jgi:hypothetical protein
VEVNINPPLPKMNLKYIITGCPCSGTHYIARCLCEKGLKAGHEVWDMKPGEWGCNKPALLDVEIDVNYGASANLINIPEGINVIHLVRNPLKVLNSWLSVHLRHPEPISINMVAERIWHLNNNVENSVNLIYRHLLESPLDKLLKAMGYQAKAEGISIPTNYMASNQGRCNFNWHEDFDNHPWCMKVRDQYKSYGYDSN